MTIQEIVHEVLNEAGFLRMLRSKSVRAPQISLRDLILLDERLEAQIDVLRVAGDAAWDRCETALAGADPDFTFAAAVLAFESGNESRIDHVLQTAGEDPDQARVIISALGWIEFEKAKPQIYRLLTTPSPFRRYLGIGGCAAHRHDPGSHLNTAAYDSSSLVKTRALRAFGEIGCFNNIRFYPLRQQLAAAEDGIRFSAAWSLALAGDDEAVEALKPFVADPRFGEEALNLLLRRLKPATAVVWQHELAASPARARLAVLAAGIVGEVSAVPWLLEQMTVPEMARCAGEAFTMITGVDVAAEGLQGLPPEGFAAGPTDDPQDSNVELDPDEDLPWPEPFFVGVWWRNHRRNYQNGVRYLLGKPIVPDQLRRVLLVGGQRQRAAAALELALMEPGRPLFNVRAPAFRQMVTSDGHERVNHHSCK
ncbi:TIGR02270 family protein [Geomesophilobacter sediminis]|nr:TIGR02270 family protein [Geomesophilobacter sediminis]